jgi:hypothetical protein
MAKSARDTGVGKGAVGGFWIVVLGIIFVTFAMVLFYAVITFWPPTPNPTVSPEPDFESVFFGRSITISPERGLLLIVALAGALGAMGYVLRSFAAYVGERQLVWSWIPSYLLSPFIGALFATFFYVLLRAGLITGSASEAGNPFGFVAIAALVGLFSPQAATKLKEVFETIFAQVAAGTESIVSAKEGPVIASFSPVSGEAGAEVQIVGTGLEEADEVFFGGDISAEATFDEASKTLRTKVPEGAGSGPLVVTLDSGTAESKDTFTVETKASG